jgi:hypothetical protein
MQLMVFQKVLKLLLAWHSGENDITNQFVDSFVEELGHFVVVKVHTELHSEATPQF